MTALIQIPVPEERKLGPAMRALGERQRAFVVAWFHFGGNASKASVAAGYVTRPDVGGHRIYHNEKIQAAIAEFATMNLKTEQLVLASSAMSEMLADTRIEPSVRAKLVLAVMDRTGLHATAHSKVEVAHTIEDRREQIRRLVTLARQLGQDPRTLIGAAADVTDADYELIDESVPSSEGLEDVL